MMLALLVAVGWEFGVIEALCVSILIGTSIDYCIHMAVSYVEAGRTSPQERLLESLVRKRRRSLLLLFHCSAQRVLRLRTDFVLRMSQTRRGSTLAQGRTGSTITGGACTTIVSSLMLCFCQITVFNKIALVMIFNTVVGYAMALLFFASLMSIVYVERRAHLPSVETEMSELTRAADDTPER
jgi:predicted RND superfamily exporter protein